LDEAKKKSILLFGSASFPDFLALIVQETQYEAIKQALAKAQADANPGALSKYAVATPLTVAAIGLGLDALNKILAFAKTDYKFANVDVASSDAMLLSELAGRLSARNLVVELPYTFLANPVAATNPALQRAIDIYGWGVDAKKTVKRFQEIQAAIEKLLAATPADAQLKTDLQTAKDAVTTWVTFGDAIDAWSKTATTVDDKGATPLATVVRQAAIRQKLDNGASFLVVQVHKVAGTTYTKKNILSSLGGNPFFVMGGSVASYTLFDGKTGRVLGSSLTPLHGGYLSVDELKATVNVVDEAKATVNQSVK
jgi:hypothetical protein